MEQRRLELHDILCNILGFTNEKDKHCYYSPPNGKQLKYPCIVYKNEGLDSTHADNVLYLYVARYSVTLIDEDPDSPIREKLLKLPMISMGTPFAVDGLNHFPFTLYF